jgi:hypothetical protein
MKRKRLSEEQILAILKQLEAGAIGREVCRRVRTPALLKEKSVAKISSGGRSSSQGSNPPARARAAAGTAPLRPATRAAPSCDPESPPHR